MPLSIFERTEMPHNKTHESYGAELRDIREALGITQDALGARLGVNSMTISRYERGERHVPEPTIRLAREILKAHTGKTKLRGAR